MLNGKPRNFGFVLNTSRVQLLTTWAYQPGALCFAVVQDLSSDFRPWNLLDQNLSTLQTDYGTMGHGDCYFFFYRWLGVGPGVLS